MRNAKCHARQSCKSIGLVPRRRSAGSLAGKQGSAECVFFCRTLKFTVFFFFFFFFFFVGGGGGGGGVLRDGLATDFFCASGSYSWGFRIPIYSLYYTHTDFPQYFFF